MTATEFREELKELLKKCPKNIETLCITAEEDSKDFNLFLQGKEGNLTNMVANALISDSELSQILSDAIKSVLIYKKEEK